VPGAARGLAWVLRLNPEIASRGVSTGSGGLPCPGGAARLRAGSLIASLVLRHPSPTGER
jgi:hypothetical protein